MPVPPGVLFGIDPHWLLQQRLETGARYRKAYLDINARKVMWETAAVIGQSMQMFAGERLSVWEVETRQEGPDKSSLRLFFTEDGRTLRMTDGSGFVWRMVTRAEAEQETTPAAILTEMPLNFELHAWDYFEELRLSFSPPGVFERVISTNDYQFVERRGAELLVVTAQRIPRGSQKHEHAPEGPRTYAQIPVGRR